MEPLYEIQTKVGHIKADTTNAMKHLVEIPLLSSTSLDYTLLQGVNKRTLQKRRSEIRNFLGLPKPESISLGRLGRFNLETASMLLCQLTATRWPEKSYSETICNAFLQSGLSEVANSTIYQESLDLAVYSVKNAVRSSVDNSGIPVIVNRTMHHLLTDAEPVRELAKLYSNVVEQVAADLPAVNRLTGEVVRFEGTDALLTVDNGEREELRLVDAEYLKQSGIDQEQEAFVLFEQQWSPDTTVRYYQPAFVEPSTIDEMIELDEKLTRAESPLSAG